MMHINLKKLHPDFWNGFLTTWMPEHFARPTRAVRFWPSAPTSKGTPMPNATRLARRWIASHVSAHGARWGELPEGPT